MLNHPASYATPEGLILSMKRDVNVDSIIIPARVHPNNGPVTIYVPAIESLPFNRKSLLYSGPVPCVVTMCLYCRWLVSCEEDH